MQPIRQEPSESPRNQDVHAKKRTCLSAQTAALTKAQAEHKAWPKKHGTEVTKNTLRT
jgi:hypothetical protein